MLYHLMGFVIGFLLDLLFGDPQGMPHPVRLIGNWISFWDKKLNRAEDSARAQKNKGLLLVVLVAVGTGVCVSAILICAYLLHPAVGVAVEGVLTYYALAMHSLKKESMKVYFALREHDLEKARAAVSMIVGRDTERLTEEGVAKAAIETVAENTSDGVIAPMLYLAVGGPILGYIYKAINTMDSMIGYKNDKYINFGRAAAKLDDLVNLIPSRLSAFFLLAASVVANYDFRHGIYIFKRDRFNHASPNSAQTESACAGILNIRLAGDAYYFGKLCKKPYIGDANREVECEDIRRVNRLMYIACAMFEMVCVVIMAMCVILL